MKKQIFTLLLAFVALCSARTSAQEAYAVVSADQSSVTFYYDNQKAARNGVNLSYSNWATENLITATFDASFANYDGLTSLRNWFWECKNLTGIVGIGNLNTSNVTDMYGLFTN
ncbi:MAG: hypothetical protein J6Y84_05930 [Bacteroidaceae bacterium]|nr:hypothetical protein [Bacteroidaceae bacterium]